MPKACVRDGEGLRLVVSEDREDDPQAVIRAEPTTTPTRTDVKLPHLGMYRHHKPDWEAHRHPPLVQVDLRGSQRSDGWLRVSRQSDTAARPCEPSFRRSARPRAARAVLQSGKGPVSGLRS